MVEEWTNVEGNPIVLDAKFDYGWERLDNGDDDYDKDDDDADSEGGVIDSNNKKNDNSVVMNAMVQATSQLTLKDTEGKLNEAREYTSATGTPWENIDLLIRVAINLRKHNASKPRQQKSTSSFFSVHYL